MNGWVNNREAGDLRRYLAHYDVIVMQKAAVVIAMYMELIYFFLKRRILSINKKGDHTLKPVFI